MNIWKDVFLFLAGFIVATFLWADMVNDQYAGVEKKSMVCTYKDAAYHMVEVKP